MAYGARQQAPRFMETAVRDSDYVIIVCTPRYKERSDNRLGGVGYEGTIMTAEVFNRQNQRKFIPLLRTGRWEEAAPSWLLGKYHLAFTGNPYTDTAYRELLKTLKGRRPEPPPVGQPAADMSPSTRLPIGLPSGLIGPDSHADKQRVVRLEDSSGTQKGSFWPLRRCTPSLYETSSQWCLNLATTQLAQSMSSSPTV